MTTRQKLEHIERKPKTVHKLTTWSDPANLLADPAIAAKVVHLVRCIENGTPLPSGYYRKGVGLNSDALLQNQGIMHLHLGKSNTSALLYLIQYPDHVVLLELSGHAHFSTRPPGTPLTSRHVGAASRMQNALAASPVEPKQPLMKQRKRIAPSKAPRPPKRGGPGSDPV